MEGYTRGQSDTIEISYRGFRARELHLLIQRLLRARTMDGNLPGVSPGVFQPDFKRRPIGAKTEMLRPLDNHDGFFGQRIFKAERLEIMETFNAVEIDVVDLASVRARLRLLQLLSAKFMHQIEGGAGDVFFPGRAEAADNSLGQRGLAAAKVSLQEDQYRRAEFRAQFPAFGDGFFGGVSDEFVHRDFHQTTSDRLRCWHH